MLRKIKRLIRKAVNAYKYAKVGWVNAPCWNFDYLHLDHLILTCDEMLKTYNTYPRVQHIGEEKDIRDIVTVKELAKRLLNDVHYDIVLRDFEKIERHEQEQDLLHWLESGETGTKVYRRRESAIDDHCQRKAMNSHAQDWNLLHKLLHKRSRKWWI